ncbi:MAG: D-alanine--D-alanine ligase family protein [Nevskiaceae bacterium]
MKPRNGGTKRLNVLLLFDVPGAFPRGHDYKEEFADHDQYATENDVHRALLDNGHEVRLLGLYDDVQPLLDEVKEHRPDLIFNLVELFHNVTHWDKNIVALIEMLGVPHTGASSSALFLCNDKAMCKKILRFHRVRTPRFHTFYRGQLVWLPSTLKPPCIVKPLTEEASRGISQASVVDDQDALIERVDMIHQRMDRDAIAEEYVEGRELYVSVVGDARLRVLPPREMTFGQMSDDEPRIATYKAKWDDAYRKRWGIRNAFAGGLGEDLAANIHDTCKRAYRALNIRSYARFDLRTTAAGQVYVIEPNVNPNIARDDEVAQSAAKVGITYPALIRMLVNQAIRQKR